MHLQSKLQQQNSANCSICLQYVQKKVFTYTYRSGKYDLEDTPKNSLRVRAFLHSTVSER